MVAAALQGAALGPSLLALGLDGAARALALTDSAPTSTPGPGDGAEFAAGALREDDEHKDEDKQLTELPPSASPVLTCSGSAAGRDVGVQEENQGHKQESQGATVGCITDPGVQAGF